MANPGIIGAFSRNQAQESISDKDLMSWYDNIHIPDVIATSGIKTALRFEALDATASWPWLVIYPVDDILFSETEEFDRIPKGGHKELGGREFTDLAALDLRICRRLGSLEASNGSQGRYKHLLAESITAPESLDQKLEQWIKEVFLPRLRLTVPSGWRVTWYRLHRGLTETTPRHLVLYEIDGTFIQESQLIKVRTEVGVSDSLGDEVIFHAFPYKLVKTAGVVDKPL